MFECCSSWDGIVIHGEALPFFKCAVCCPFGWEASNSKRKSKTISNSQPEGRFPKGAQCRSNPRNPSLYWNSAAPKFLWWTPSCKQAAGNTKCIKIAMGGVRCHDLALGIMSLLSWCIGMLYLARACCDIFCFESFWALFWVVCQACHDAFLVLGCLKFPHAWNWNR